MSLKLKMTCGPYDRAKPLIDGIVKPEGIDLEITVDSNDRRRQQAARDGKFDIAEFFTGIYIADLEWKTLGITAVPIFVKRMFRHSYIYVNRRAGIRSPADLNGRRIGVQTWLTSAALWGRAILADDCGVDLKSVTWVAERAEMIGEWKRPSWLKLEVAPEGLRLHDLIVSGKIDAGITTETWAPDGHPDIDFLFPDYARREREYFKRTRVFPIHHTLMIQNSVLEKNPWVAMSMFKAWMEAKERCYKRLEWERVHLTSLWFRALWEEERGVAGPDIYPWGFKKTRAEVDHMLDQACRQGFTTRKLSPEDMFHPTTLET